MSDTSAEPQNKTAELLEPTDYGEFLLRNRSEILYVLRQLLDRGSQITIFFNEGADLILTTLLAVNEEGLVFDHGASADTNQRALGAAKLFCITSLDKVKVQFILHGFKTVKHDARAAFFASLPDSVLRLQRREYFRLAMPLTRRLACHIPLEEGQSIEVDVVDLSGGGLAMVAPPDVLHVEPEKEFADCSIDLPEIGTITATLQILTVFELTLRNGIHVKRAGCKFVNLPGTMSNQIQRYITKTERERKARESGLL